MLEVATYNSFFPFAYAALSKVAVLLHGLLFLFIYFAQRLLQSALYPVDHASLLKVTCFPPVIGPFSIACAAVKGNFII